MTEEAQLGADALSSKNRSHTRSRTTETFKQIQASFQQEDKAREDEITRRRASMRAEIRQARGSADTNKSPTLAGFTMAKDEQMSPKKDFEELIAKSRGGRSVKAMASQWTGKSLIETNEMAQRRLLETEKAYRRGSSRMSADLTSLLAEGHDQLFKYLKGAPTPEAKQVFMCAWAKDRRAKGKEVTLEDGMALLKQLGVNTPDTKGTPLIKKHSSLGATPSSPSVSMSTPKIPATDTNDSHTITDVASPTTTASSPWKRSESEWKGSESEGKGEKGEWEEWMAALMKAMDVANDRLSTGEGEGGGSSFLQKRESWEARERKAAKAGFPNEAWGRAHSLVRNSSTDSEGGGRWSGNGQVIEAEMGNIREARQSPERQEGLSTTESQGSAKSVSHERGERGGQQQQQQKQTWSPPDGQHEALLRAPSAATQSMQEQASAQREQQAEHHTTHVHAAPQTHAHEDTTEQPSDEVVAASAAELETGDRKVRASEPTPTTNGTERPSQSSEATSAANIDPHTHRVTCIEGEGSTPNNTADAALAHAHECVDNGIPADVLAAVGKHGYWFSHTWRPLIPLLDGTAHTQNNIEVGGV